MRDETREALETLRQNLKDIDAVTDIGAEPMCGETTRYPEGHQLYDEWLQVLKEFEYLAAVVESFRELAEKHWDIDLDEPL